MRFRRFGREKYRRRWKEMNGEKITNPRKETARFGLLGFFVQGCRFETVPFSSVVTGQSSSGQA